MPPDASTPPAAEYVLGHDLHELERLALQSTIISGITRRLIGEAGVRPGMRILEIGCGAGDVTLLLAKAVGPTGSIVAFDREPRAVALARQRVREAGWNHVEFLVSADDAMPQEGGFDAAFGRYVLIHQTNPVDMVRRAASAVRFGGVVAFHEVALHVDSLVRPKVTIYSEIDRCVIGAFRQLLSAADVAGRLCSVFVEAGLPSPNIFWESVVGDHTSAMWRWAAMNYRSMLPQVLRIGLNPTLDPDVDLLTDRMQQEARHAQAQLVSRPQACAWGRKS